MNIKIFATFFLATVLCNTKAQTKVTPSLLLKISGNNLEQPSYIFGTFHIMCKEDFTITPALENAIKNTKQLYEELKMDDPTLLIKSMSLLKSDSSLKTLLGEEKYNILNDKYKQITGTGIAMFNNFKPMMLTSTLTMKMVDCQETVQPETEISKIAKTYAIELFGLETLEMQLNAFNTIPLKKQIEDVFTMVNNLDSSKIMMRELLKTYKNRDPELLYNFMKSAGTSGDFEENLLTKRNKNWIPIIEKNIKEKPTFFAVGAGHLGGEFGVLNLLLQKGYTIEPIFY